MLIRYAMFAVLVAVAARAWSFATPRASVEVVVAPCPADRAHSSPNSSATSTPPVRVITLAVDRPTVNTWLAKPESLLEGARIVPVIERSPRGSIDGARIGGFRLTNIHPDSYLALVGIHNGDVVQTIDGEPIAATTGLGPVAPYVAVTAPSRVHIGIDRDGLPVRLVLLLRDGV